MRVTSPPKEQHTADLPDPKLPDISLENRTESIVLADAEVLNKDYADALAFAEEPVTIMIEPPDQDNPPRVFDLWVQGRGAEVVDPLTGEWMTLGVLPIGVKVTTKRKYVEVLARSSVEVVRTQETNSRPAPGEDGWAIQRNRKRKAVFSVLDDTAKGREWLRQIVAER